MKYCILSPYVSQEGKHNVSRLGYSLLFTEPCFSFSPAVCYHPDLQFFKTPDGTLYSVGATSIPRELIPLVLAPIPSNRKDYEAEARLNVAQVGERLFGNRHLCSELIIPKTAKFIHVNQGYANCSSISVGYHALITDDPGIARAAKAEGLDCLQCEKGDVLLKGYPYGFIGGASVWLENTTLGFFGELKYHKNADEIKAFLQKYGIRILSLQKGPLQDLGGGIVIEK